MSELLPSTDSALAFASLLIGFGFVIFVHELGHFLVAKWVGIKVTQFAIGFGPSITAWRKGVGFRMGSTEKEYEKRLADGADPAALGETEYRLNWLPLGGYVKMLGQEDLDPKASSNDPRSFTAKPIWARACVVCAGVVMNLIFAVIFFIVCFLQGVEFPPAIAGPIDPSLPAATTYADGHDGDPAYLGIQPGDRITHIDGEPIDDFLGLAVQVALAPPNTSLRLTAERTGEPGPLSFTVRPVERDDSGLLALGVGRPVSLTVGRLIKDGELQQAGVELGMEITEVAGQPVDGYGQASRLLTDASGKPVPVTFVKPAAQDKDKRPIPAKTVTVPISAVAELCSTPDGVTHLIGLRPATVVIDLAKNSAAEEAGLKAGDILESMNGEPWPGPRSIARIVKDAGDRPIAITVLRDGKTVSVPPVTPKSNKLFGLGKRLIGIMYGSYSDEPLVGDTLPGSPFATLGLNGGTRITTIDGKPAMNWNTMQRLLQDALDAAGGESATVRIGYRLNVKDSPEVTGTVTIAGEYAKSLASAGWLDPLVSYLNSRRDLVKASNPWTAAVIGIKKTHEFMLQTYVTLLRLFQGTVPFSEMRGPVGIVQIGTQTAEQGYSYLLFFLGVISVNLVVINFLPIPVVDGGLMVFLVIEKIKGSPVGPRVQTAATLAGLAMILCVFLVVTFYDVTRLFQ